jgi:hypothetical protein
MLILVVKGMGDERTLRIYCSNHPAAPRYCGNGFVFDLRGLHYVFTARHVIFRKQSDQTYNYIWVGDRINNKDNIDFLWGDKDLDIAVLKKSEMAKMWAEGIQSNRRLPPADSIALRRLAIDGTQGEIRCIVEGADLNPIPVIIKSHVDEEANEVGVLIVDKSRYNLTEGMSGGLVYVEDKLFGVLTAADTISGIGIVKRWDIVRKAIIENLNREPIQNCLREWEARRALLKKFKIGTGLLFLTTSGLAVWNHRESEKKYDEYQSAIAPDRITDFWNNYEKHVKSRNVFGGVALGLMAIEVALFYFSPDRPALDGDCVQKLSQGPLLGLKATPGSFAIFYQW